ncbi:hypothetical protein BC829DRAFT_360092 [Chytridium lagenaria]|nr:hypothetical protein BC829DRAFT_360092 [Chytridium lagenaria]
MQQLSIDGSGDEDGEDSRGKYKCELCPRTFSRLYNLNSHVKTHSDQRPFECKHCDQRFARKHDLNRHMKRHSNEKPHCCNVSENVCEVISQFYSLLVKTQS